MLTRISVALLVLVGSITFACAQTFSSIESYCAAMSEMSSPTLQARVSGVSKQNAIKMMQGMTDPASVRMVKEIIEFAYSQPPEMKTDAMRTEVRKLCIERKIFVQ